VQHDFADKTVLITGAARGQGAAEARLFAQAGAHVIVSDVLNTDGGELIEAISAAGGSANTADLTSPASRIGATPSPSQR